MPRSAFKPDSSFFRKIALGAVGARAVCADLNRHGHALTELERGATDTKLWKDVKRKRVRIPDLVCTRCGVRVESRTKTKADLSMSHSTENSRTWDFGMVDADLIAFPVCVATKEAYWSRGKLSNGTSYWHERNWVEWKLEGTINYFTRQAFRAVPFIDRGRKGVTEGSEATIGWPAAFSKVQGVIQEIRNRRIIIQSESDGRVSYRQVRDVRQELLVTAGDTVGLNQVIASSVRPTVLMELTCPGLIPNGHTARLLLSREKTQRFTGLKLARLRIERDHCASARTLADDAEEDIYVRLEAIAYLASVCNEPLEPSIRAFLSDTDPQNRLEAVITLAESGTPAAVNLLSATLQDVQLPYFLRSAAAWGLGKIGGDAAIELLIRAFSDVNRDIREEALDGIVYLGGAAVPALIGYLTNENMDIAAGAAEAVRQFEGITDAQIGQIAQNVGGQNPATWPVWLLGHVERGRVNEAIAGLQDTAPELHYALSVLWSFCESWIARHWDLNPSASFPIDVTAVVPAIDEETE